MKNKFMNILFITDPYIVGGATKSFVELVNNLHENYEINAYVCTGSYTSLNEDLEKNNIFSIDDGHLTTMEADFNQEKNIFSLEKWKQVIDYYKSAKLLHKRNAAAINKIERYVDLNLIDIIHTNSARTDIGCELSIKYHIPHIMHIREFGVEDFNCRFLRRNYCAYLNKGTDSFLSVSRAVRDVWIKRGIDSQKISVLYNGIKRPIDLVNNFNDMRQSSKLKLVAAGGIYPTKGQYQIIEALGILPEEIKQNITLDLYGWSDENYIEQLMHRANDLGIANQVTWQGTVDNIFSVLDKYHVGLTCSRAEGFGRVTAEYMHAGLGVIVSDKGANTEIISNGENGLIYQWNDYEDLSKKLVRFYDDRDFLVSCGQRAKKDALDKYLDERNAAGIYEEYKRVIDEREKN